jgi:hypothetical protein
MDSFILLAYRGQIEEKEKRMKRKEGQAFEDYKKERRAKQENLKQYLAGRLVFSGGTYNAGKNEAKRMRRVNECRQWNNS